MENTKTEQTDLSAYQAPEAELLDENNNADATAFFPVSHTKLVVMYVMTIGLYSVIWFYHNWKLQKPNMPGNIWPVPRAIFSIFFVHSLFKRMHEKTEEMKIEDWNHSGLATFFVIFAIIGNVADRIFEKVDGLAGLAPLAILLSMLPLHSLYQAQKRANLINNDPNGQLNANFTAANILFIILGVIWWGLVVVGSFILMAE